MHTQVRAWSADLERRSPEGKLLAGLWICCKGVVAYAPLASAGASHEGHARSWFTGDGLQAWYATELLTACKEHRDPRTAVKLYSNVATSAWARMPPEVATKFGVRRESLCAPAPHARARATRAARTARAARACRMRTWRASTHACMSCARCAL